MWQRNVQAHTGTGTGTGTETGASTGAGTTGTGMGTTGTGLGTTGSGMGTTGTEHHHHSGTTGDLHTGGVTGEGCLPVPACAVAVGPHAQLHGMLPTLLVRCISCIV